MRRAARETPRFSPREREQRKRALTYLGQLAKAVKKASRVLYVFDNLHGAHNVELLAFLNEVLGGAMAVLESVLADT